MNMIEKGPKKCTEKLENIYKEFLSATLTSKGSLCEG
jgi:hypothetical protein